MKSLEARDLCCIRDDRTLFKQLNFDINSGQMLLIEGNNGSGKTSLLRILSGIRMPEEGTVNWIKTIDNKKHSASVHQQDGFVGDMGFLGHLDGNKLDLTVTENINFALSLSSANDEPAIKEVLERVDLALFDDVLVSNLSAGQRRRLALARLILSGTTLWIMDEPFTALDKTGIGVIEKEFLKHLENGGMIAMTTHHSISFQDKNTIRLNLSE